MSDTHNHPFNIGGVGEVSASHVIPGDSSSPRVLRPSYNRPSHDVTIGSSASRSTSHLSPPDTMASSPPPLPSSHNLTSASRSSSRGSLYSNKHGPGLSSKNDENVFRSNLHINSDSIPRLTSTSSPLIPHRGSLRRVPTLQNDSGSKVHNIAVAAHKPLEPYLYCIELIHYNPLNSSTSPSRPPPKLLFTKYQLDSMQRLFLILDTHSRGWLDYNQVKEFVNLRCSVVRRRDNAAASPRSQGGRDRHDDDNHSARLPHCSTLDEAWHAIANSGLPPSHHHKHNFRDMNGTSNTVLGMEGWMILLRFISFCQYTEAKQCFSAKHLGNTNLVMVDVPRTMKIISLTMEHLLQYESKFQRNFRKKQNRHHRHEQGGNEVQSGPMCAICPPMPELDLNHCCISAHEDATQSPFSAGESLDDKHNHMQDARVQVDSFHSHPSSNHHISKIGGVGSVSGSTLELVLTLTYTNASDTPTGESQSNLQSLMSTTTISTSTTTTVRRTLADLQWLHDTLKQHKKLGGTLCGRILPPLLQELSKEEYGYYCGKISKSSSKMYNMASSATDVVSHNLISVCKSMWGAIKRNVHHNNSPTSSSRAASVTLKKKSTAIQCAGNSSSGNDNHGGVMVDQDVHLKRIERYLNYLLEHGGLRSSFPLNAILKASKTGLEAAKRMLHEESFRSGGGTSGGNYHKEISDVESNAGSSFNNHKKYCETSSATNSSNNGSNQSGSHSHNLEWIRTAAQAAMALKLHSMMDATGMSSYSAKLQLSSLPVLDYHQSYREDIISSSPLMETPQCAAAAATGPTHDTSTWEEDGYTGIDMDMAMLCNLPSSSISTSKAEFEHGVKTVECDLDDEYDMLPSPNSGNNNMTSNLSSLSIDGPVYNMSPYASCEQLLLHNVMMMQNNNVNESCYAIDSDIETLRDIIGTIDSTLKKCVAAHQRIANARRISNGLHLGIVRGLDTHSSNEGGGYYVGGGGNCGAGIWSMEERSFLGGVTDLEQCGELVQEGDFDLGEALSWQASLATSAVSAAEDVRSAVRAARTAASAKTAAESATLSAQKSLDKLIKSKTSSNTSGADASSSDKEAEIHAAQTRATISHGHAIHAAIIAYETTAVKRKAAMALAHDVRQWNVHRKREMLDCCIHAALSQRDAARKSSDAWRVLKEGMDGPCSPSFSLPVGNDFRNENVAPNDKGNTFGECQHQNNRASGGLKYGLSISDDVNNGIHGHVDGHDMHIDPDDLLGGTSLMSTSTPIIAVDHVALSSQADHNKEYSSPEEVHHETPSIASSPPALPLLDSRSSSTSTALDVSPFPPPSTKELLSETTLAEEESSTELSSTMTHELPADDVPLPETSVTIIQEATTIEPKILEVTTSTNDTITETEFSFDDAAAEEETPIVTNTTVTIAETSSIHATDHDEERRTTSSFLSTHDATSNIQDDDQDGDNKIIMDEGQNVEQEQNYCVENRNVNRNIDNVNDHNHHLQNHPMGTNNISSSGASANLIAPLPSPEEEREDMTKSMQNREVMTASMQSLVDGLMAWGGRYDPQDDMSLPTGLAVSIALEESGILGQTTHGL